MTKKLEEMQKEFKKGLAENGKKNREKVEELGRKWVTYRGDMNNKLDFLNAQDQFIEKAEIMTKK